MSEQRQPERFLRILGRREVLALAFGAMIGWSWVVLTGNWILSAGVLGAIAAFLVGGAGVALIGLTYAELASALPFVGGEHVYSERALGTGASFVCTWAIILGYVSVVTFEAVALPTVASSLVPGLDRVLLWQVAGWNVHLSWVLVGMAGAIVMTLVNVLGIRMAAVVQSAVVLVILLVGVLFAGGALVSGDPGNFEPLFRDGASGIALVLVMVPFMFVGFDVIPQAAEEIDLAFEDIGKVLMISVSMAIAWYSLIIAGVGLMMDEAAIGGVEIVTAEANALIYGEIGGKVLVVAGLAGIITSWNAFLVGGSRAIYALAQARMLPACLARIHPSYKTPVNAILLIGALSAIGPLFGRPALVWLVDAGGLGITVAYAMVALSFLVLRKKEPELERPYRVRLGKSVGALALLVSIGLAALYLPGSPAALAWPQEWLIVIFWVALGSILYTVARLHPRSV
jgi:APA family basic amino acid/polyamine antiporter